MIQFGSTSVNKMSGQFGLVSVPFRVKFSSFHLDVGSGIVSSNLDRASFAMSTSNILALVFYSHISLHSMKSKNYPIRL